MKSTTAQQFGSLGKSFGAPAAAAAVIGAALLASDTSDTSETAWSPAAACLLPDVLPVAGTLLSYGGSRQLAAGGTVTHSGALNLGANALTVGAITASGDAYLNTSGGYTYVRGARSIVLGSSSAGTVMLSGDYTGVANTATLTIGDAGGGSSKLACGAITASGIVGINRAGVTNVPLSIQTNATSSDGMYLYNNSGTLVSDFGVTGGGHLRWRFRDSTSTTKVTINTDGAYPSIECGAITASGTIDATSFRKTGTTTQALQPADGIWYIDGTGGIRYRDTGSAYATTFQVSNAGNVTCGAITASGTLTVNSAQHLVSPASSTALYELIVGGRYAISYYGGTGYGVQPVNIHANGGLAVLAGGITASGPIQETPTQSALDPTTTNIPSGKRQGWYNSTLSEFRDWVNIGGTLLKSAAYT